MRRLLPVVLVGALLVGVPATGGAVSDKGVDELRGRWDLALAFDFDTVAVEMLVVEVAPDPADPDARLASGCWVSGGSVGPMSMRAVEGPPGTLETTVFGTLSIGPDTSVVRLDGMVELLGSGVSDDMGAGDLLSGFGEGTWTGVHHDRRLPKCPAVQGPAISFEGDVYTALNAQDPGGGSTLLEAFTNLVSSAMLAESASLGSVIVPQATDIFSPTVDFVTEFRYVSGFPGTPAIGEEVTFTLLDLFGNPIEGAQSVDVWNGCFQGAPQNVGGTFTSGVGIDLTWDAVPPATGFDPGSGLGFYQIEAAGPFGASGMVATSHLIPWDPFLPGTPGTPDGQDFGISLSELDDGLYAIDVISFAVDVGPGGIGLACQVRDESTFFEKSGDDITIPAVP